jgi:hypothetical protein
LARALPSKMSAAIKSPFFAKIKNLGLSLKVFFL